MVKNKQIKGIAVLVSALFICFFEVSFSISTIAENNVTARVYFPPHRGATEAIITELNRAKTPILVQAYSFTSTPIAKALLNAHKRGVKVEVILDKSQRTAQYSSVTFLHNQGIPVKMGSKQAIAHNKVIIRRCTREGKVEIWK